MRTPTDRRLHHGRSRRRPRSAVAIGYRLGAAGFISGLAIVSIALPSTEAASAATLPVVNCSTNQNIFNTGYDAATGGVLPNGSQDANWVVAGEFDTPNGATPPSAVSLPPAGATFAPANVGRLTTLWSPSPFGNAQWISQQTQASPRQPNEIGDWYYEYQFTLDPSVNPSTFSLDMNFLADNEIAEVYVNGVAQSPQTTGLPQAPSTADPYTYKGYLTAVTAVTTLDHNWQTGTNTIIAEIKSAHAFEGLDAQIRPSALCPVALGATKTAAPDPYVPGQPLTYTVTVTNSGPGNASGVTVSDPLPSALAGAGFTWTCTATTGSTCTASGSGNISDTVSVVAGGTLTYTVKGTVPASASGTLTNTVTVTPPAGTADTGCTPNCSATNNDPSTGPSLTVVKSSPTTSFSAVGNTVSYNFLVTNTGTTTLNNITVNDTETAPATEANLSPIVCPDSSLAGGAFETCTATYTVTSADLTHGSVSDSATASGTTPAPTTTVTSLPSTATVSAATTTASTSLTESANPTSVTSGTSVTFTYKETNTGTAPITDVTVTGSSCGPATFVSSSDSDTTTLDPGATWTFTCAEVLTNTGTTNKTVTDTATATGMAGGVATSPETAHATVTVKPGPPPPPCSISVTVAPNPLVETGQSEVHGVVQVGACPSYAGDPVSISSSQLVGSCGSVAFYQNTGTTVSELLGPNATVTLDNDGNTTVEVSGIGCAPGMDLIEADLDDAPYLTAVTELDATPPNVTTTGLTAYPNPEVETGDGTLTGSNVYAVFYFEDSPVYAETNVEIASSELQDRCLGGWEWTSGNGGGTSTTSGVTTTLDDDGNAVFIFEGISCAAGPSTVIGTLLGGTHDSFPLTFTISPPTPTV